MIPALLKQTVRRFLLLALVLPLVYATSAIANDRGFFWDPANGLIEFGTLGGTNSFAYDVNDSGQVTGYADTPANQAHAILWQNDISGGTMNDLGTLAGGSASFGKGINNAGDVVGDSNTGSGEVHAFYYSAATTTMQDLGTLPGHVRSSAMDVNNAALPLVIGHSQSTANNPPESVRGFVWDSTNGMRELPPLSGGDASYGHGVNDSGIVVGYANQTAEGAEFYLVTWDCSGAIPGEAVLVDGSSAAGVQPIIIQEPIVVGAKINNGGQIAGHYRYSGVASRAFFWDPATYLTDLGTIGSGERTWGQALNDGGYVVGFGLTGMQHPDDDHNLNHAFRWNGTTPIVLEDFTAPYLRPDDDSRAYGINSSGQIVGSKTPNTPPLPPEFVNPLDGATDVPLRVVLETNPFVDPDSDNHGTTIWQISTRAFDNPLFGPTDLVLDVVTPGPPVEDPVQLTVPDSLLEEDTTYYVRALFTDEYGTRSEWSGDGNPGDDPDDNLAFTTETLETGDAGYDGNGDGVPDDQEVDYLVDMDGDGNPDVTQADLKCVDTAAGDGQIAIQTSTAGAAITSLKAVDPTTISDTENRPEMLPLGLISYKVTVASAGDPADITVYLSDPLPVNEWHKYDTVNGWQDFSANVTFTSSTEVTISVTDGGAGDADGVANGIIVEPSGFGFAASPNVPAFPTLLSPIASQTVATLTPTLTADIFSDVDGDNHLKTRWQITRISDAKIILDVTSSTQLTQFEVPPGILNAGQTYSWQALYMDHFYAESLWSGAELFATFPAAGFDDNADGTADSQGMDAVIDVDTDMDADGTADIGQADIKCVHTVVDPYGIAVTNPIDSNGMIGVKTSTGAVTIKNVVSVDPADTSDVDRPEKLPLGLVAFTVTVTNPGDAAEVLVFLSHPAPPSPQWYKYDPDDGWVDYTVDATHYAAFNVDRDLVTLQIQDGDIGDADGTENGIINVIGGFGFAASDAPVAPALVSPADDATGVSLTPTLQASAFNDPGESHFRTHWRIVRLSDAEILLDVYTGVYLEQIPVPDTLLSQSTVYNWQVRHFDDYYEPSPWSVVRSFTTGVDATDLDNDGTPDVQQLDPVSDVDVDMDGDGNADYSQSDMRCVHTVVSGGMIGIKLQSLNEGEPIGTTSIEKLQSIDATTIPGSPASFPLGLIGYNLIVPTPGDLVNLTVYLSSPMPLNEWWKYNTIDGWVDYASHISDFSGDRKSLTLRVKDGSIGDADGIANGIIVDPSGFSVPASAQPNQPSAVSPASGSTAVELTPILQTSAFSDPDAGDTHLMTAWEIATDAGFSNLVVDIVSSTHLTSLPLPDYVLNPNTTYYWRVTYYDQYYTASLPSSVASFTTVTNDPADLDGNGLADVQELDALTDAHVDMDDNGEPDTGQANILSIHSDAAVAHATLIGLQPSTGIASLQKVKSVDPQSIAGRPVTMPLGLVNVKAAVSSPGSRGSVRLYFSQKVPASIFEWWAYNAIDGWYNYDAHASQVDEFTVDLEIEDGGFGDADGTANGTIILMSGFGFTPVAGTPIRPILLTPADTSSGVTLTPTLTFDYYDPVTPVNRPHLKTRWQLATDNLFSNIVFDTESFTQLTALDMPEYILDASQTYYWRVQTWDEYYMGSTWAVPFSFTTGAGTGLDGDGDGIPDSQQLDAILDADVDMDEDGNPDIGQADMRCVHTVLDPFGTGMIGVQRSTNVTDFVYVQSVDFSSLPHTAGSPDQMPLGLINSKMSVSADGAVGSLIFYLSDPPPVSEWYAYDPVNGWLDYSAYASFSPDRKTVTVQIQDGGYGDADGVANGIVVLNSGFGFANSPNPPSQPTLLTPADGAVNQAITPLLITSPFSDPDAGETHFKTRWQISGDNTDEAGFMANLILDVFTHNGASLTTVELPDYIVTKNTTYYWRATFYDSYYTASPVSATYSFTTGEDLEDSDDNGIPDSQELGTQAGDDLIDLDGNGTPDIGQSDMIVVHTAVGDGLMGIEFGTSPFTVTKLKSIDPATIADDDGKPANMLLGLISYRIVVNNPGDIVDVDIVFSDPSPTTNWYKYNSLSGWKDYSYHAFFGGTRRFVTLEIQDGGIGDADGVANGIIVDPSGYGFPDSQQPYTPLLLTPADTATDVDTEPTFTTDAFADPDNEDADPENDNQHFKTVWQVSTDSGFATILHEHAPAEYQDLTSWTIPSGILTGSTTYYWRVMFQDDYYTWSDWSSVSSFTTANRAPDQPVVNAPADGMVLGSMTPNLETDLYNDPDGDGHAETQWQISTDPAFGSLLMDITSSTHLNLLPVPMDILDPETTYYWRVRYIDDVGGMSDWSLWTNPVNPLDQRAYSFTSPIDAADGDGNGMPDAQELGTQTGDDIVDLDDNTIYDISQININTVHTEIGNGLIGVWYVNEGNPPISHLASTRSLDPALITDNVGKPNFMPLGLISFKAVANGVGNLSPVTVYLSDAAPEPFWYSYDRINGWQDYSAYAVFNVDRTAITLNITDGGVGDADGTANGIIVHTGGFGFSDAGTAPDTPTLLSPSDASEVSLIPTLEGNPFTDSGDIPPDSHLRTDWQISTQDVVGADDSAFIAGIIYETTTRGTELTQTVVPEGILAGNTIYFWRIRYQDSYYAVSAWSATFSFNTTNSPPDVPVLLLPIDGAVDQSRTLQLQVDGTAYSDLDGDLHGQTEWQISTQDVVGVDDSQFVANLVQPSYVTIADVFSLDVPQGDLLGNSVYYWRARYFDDQGGPSAWSETFSFATVSNASPDPAVLSAPIDGVTGLALTPNLQNDGNYLDPDGDPQVATRWQVSTQDVGVDDTDFLANLVFDVTSATHLVSARVPDSILSASTTYYWRCAYIDDQGSNPLWPTTYSFTTGTGLADTNTNGIPDAQELDPIDDAQSDVDQNGTYDVNQADIKCVSTLIGDGIIGVKESPSITGITTVKSVDPATITDNNGKPDQMPLGMVGMKVTVATAGAAASVTVYLSDPAPTPAWYLYDSVSGWTDYSTNATFNGDYTAVTLSLQDGGNGDADYIANGVIVATGGYGFANSTAPATPVLTAPADGAIDTGLSPVLTTDVFSDSDAGDTHYQTEWQISTDNTDETAFLANLVYSVVTTSPNLTGITVPEGILDGGTPYYWRARHYDNYLTASPWSSASSFTTATVASDDTSPANGIPDLQELDPVLDADVDLDDDGTADLDQSDIMDLRTVVTVFGDEMIGVKMISGITSIASIRSIDPSTITDTNGKPDELPLGLIRFELNTTTPGGLAQVAVCHSEPSPLTAYYLYNAANGWQDYSANATFSGNRKIVTLDLRDGGIGDADGIANGVIVTTGGFGFPTSSNPPDQPQLSSPINGAADQPLSLLTLQTTGYYDPDGNAQLKSQWQISTASDFSTLVLNTITDTHFESLTIPDYVLEASTTYYWRVRFYDEYFRASVWSDNPPTLPFSFTTVTADPDDADGDGVPDSQELDPVADAGIDLDSDGTPDAAQADLKAVHTAVGAGQMAIKDTTGTAAITSVKSLDPATLPDGGDGRPTDMPLGILSFRITVPTPGDTASIRVYFSQAAPAAQWYKYDSVNSWQNYNEHATFDSSMMWVDLELMDGGYGDADGTANGIIVDPSGMGAFSQSSSNPEPDNTPSSPASTSNEPVAGGGGGGGCFVSGVCNLSVSILMKFIVFSMLIVAPVVVRKLREF